MTEEELRKECLALNALVVPYEDSAGDVDALMAFAKLMQAVGLREAAAWADGARVAAFLPHDRWDDGYKAALRNCMEACESLAQERER